MILKKLNQESENIVNQWKNPQGTSTKHFFIDNLLSNELCTSIYNSFPKDGNGFFNRNTFREKKLV